MKKKPCSAKVTLSKEHLLAGEKFKMKFEIDNEQSKRDLRGIRVHLVRYLELQDPQVE